MNYRTMQSRLVEFDKPKLARLKRAYNKAQIEGKETFTFEGNDYVVGYAKYLIEYLESKL